MLEQGSPFHTFIELVAVDEKIRLLKQQVSQLNRLIDDLQTQKNTFDTQLETARLAVIAAKKEVDAQELMMKELDGLEEQKKKLLENVSTHKDYQSLHHELMHVQARQQAQEQVVLKSWRSLELAQEVYASTKQLCDEKIALITTEIEEKMVSMGSLEQQIAVHAADRPQKEQRVPQEWLDKYAYMSGQVEDPVVPIVHESCGSCFHIITRQDIITAMKGTLVQCRGCYRLLYIIKSINP